MFQEKGQLVILSVAYPLLPVGPGSAGGAEQILHLLDRGLTESGHRSIVIAAAGSEVTGELIETMAADEEISDSERMEAQQAHLRKIQAAVRHVKVDLVHFHGLDFLAYRPRCSSPRQLATLHLPVAWYAPELFEQTNLSLNFVSESQARSALPSDAATTVLNGIDLDAFHTCKSKENYLLWLGRICPEKGVAVAARVARRLNMPLLIAGPVHPFSTHRAYFNDEVKSLLDCDRRFIGPADARQKADLLARAKCLLVPSLAPETSSLVAMEALSSGTPVVAFRSGALPEIVEDGVTGFVVNSEDEMACAVSKIASISPQVCRSRAEARFSWKRMVKDYIELYRTILSS